MARRTAPTAASARSGAARNRVVRAVAAVVSVAGSLALMAAMPARATTDVAVPVGTASSGSISTPTSAVLPPLSSVPSTAPSFVASSSAGSALQGPATAPTAFLGDSSAADSTSGGS